MASLCRHMTIKSGVGDHPFTICTSDDYYNVSVSMEVGRVGTWEYLSDWTMKLQRYENSKWNTIGTRTGYLGTNSPSHRTFTNVAKKNKPMRVWVKFHDAGRDLSTITSYSWVR